MKLEGVELIFENNDLSFKFKKIDRRKLNKGVATNKHDVEVLEENKKARFEDVEFQIGSVEGIREHLESVGKFYKYND